MSFVSILETLVLGPLKLIFEFIYQAANTIVHNPALARIFAASELCPESCVLA